MTIITKKGNLLDAKGVIVHGCNCQGVMGSGVAAQIRKKWPQVYERYKRDEKDFGLVLGDVQVVRAENDVLVVNAMTQKFYGKDGKRYVDYEAVRDCFAEINSYALGYRWDVVNFPLIGCGLAGGNWEVVSAIIDHELDESIEKVLWVQE